MTDKRTCYVGAKVTPLQQDTIRKLANRCGMTVSDYLLARSHDYEPKQRLTIRQTESLATLNDCRSDIVNYTSALRGMTAVIDELRKPNPIPQGTTNNIDNNSDL